MLGDPTGGVGETPVPVAGEGEGLSITYRETFFRDAGAPEELFTRSFDHAWRQAHTYLFGKIIHSNSP